MSTEHDDTVDATAKRASYHQRLSLFSIDEEADISTPSNEQEINKNETLEELINKSKTKLGLYLWNKQINDQQVKQITQELKKRTSTNWSYVDLSNNQITSVGVQYLCQTLKLNTTIKSYWTLAVMDSIQYLPVNKTLTFINLNSNLIDDHGIKIISDMLIVNKTLELLWLSKNQITDI
ncbi:unnamed protein product [Didymodactylos carnosus]|uniref:Uncharacterized protein n=1 Tax=Didymodactylos carnosus TaxID=1234261 RepID=A0A814Y8C5_9BILA|nr:unnamed protein product [Didymodactylos carnosus]CAF3989234.1 unnamed protein product [Didymodactylos carnosus]